MVDSIREMFVKAVGAPPGKSGDTFILVSTPPIAKTTPVTLI